jgi:hypothetical protein
MRKRIASRRVQKCPDEILNAPLAVQVKFFKDEIVHHKAFDEALEKMETAIACGLPGTMLVLVGPAGVGKSSLGDELHVRVSEEFFKSNPDDKYTVPSVCIEAWSGEDGRFDWKDFYEQILEALQAPLISNTLPEVRRVIAGREFFLPDITQRRAPTISAYRARLRRSIRERKPFVLFFDEASGIIQSSTLERVKIKSNTLRSMVNSSNTTMILSGAYDLYDLALQTGQLARRGDVIHVRPYLPHEVESVAKVFYALQEIMPVKGGCNLEPFADQIVHQALRTTGLLKKIMTRSLVLSSQLNRPIDEEILSQCYFKPAQWKKLQTDMFDGYLKVEGVQHPEDSRKLVADEEDEEKSDAGKAKPKTGNNRRVGRTKPSRGVRDQKHA